MKNVRRSQLVAPYGVGSIVNFPMEESLMTAGLDAWQFGNNPDEFIFQEERLQQRLRVEQFRLPPDFRIPGTGVRNSGIKVPFVRFPRWHYCRRCGDMRELGLFGDLQRCSGPKFAEGQSCHDLAEKKRPRLQPMRFIAVCPKNAHIQDFPWLEWAHQGKPILEACRLRYRAGGATASLAGISIRCTCGARRTLAGAMAKNSLEQGGVEVRCGGLRPWLGETTAHHPPCGESLQVVQRGASNVYFDHTASSIYLPLWSEKTSRSVIDILEDALHWSVLSKGLVNGKVDPARCEMVCELRKMTAADVVELQKAAQRKLDGQAPAASAGTLLGNPFEEEEEYRQAEYEALRTGRGGKDTGLYCVVRSADTYGTPVREFFSRIGLVHKLRETRALCGFSRYRPDDERSQADKMAVLQLDPHMKWLPAVYTQGEGIFFELEEALLQAWLQRPDVGARVRRLHDSFNAPGGRPAVHGRTVTPKFVLIHTLAHVLINRLSFECGYGSSSLRERIYCDAEFPAHPMSGFLIYTAAGDSDGTMGGLVRQGTAGRIEGVLNRALRQAGWCSYDPVCAESDGQGPDSCNLAACHGCAVLPETSCEEGNRLLDRVVVGGSPDRPDLGLFGSHVRSLLAM